MHKYKYNIQVFLLLIVAGLLSACNGEVEETGNDEPTITATVTVALSDPPTATLEATPDVVVDATDPLADWLTGVQNGSIEAVNMGERLEWAVGYFLYYGSVEGLGVDNLIYNALESYRRFERGEVTAETQPRGDKNLMEIADMLDYSDDGSLVDQVGQTPEIRAAILAHVVDSQSNLSPDEALASGNVVGLIAPPAPNSVGEKFLVYGQASPTAEFEFVGIALAVDATGSDNVGDVYSHEKWNELRWLGDATGPFWEDLPLGTSDDPTNVEVAKPGVLLINETTFERIISEQGE